MPPVHLAKLNRNSPQGSPTASLVRFALLLLRLSCGGFSCSGVLTSFRMIPDMISLSVFRHDLIPPCSGQCPAPTIRRFQKSKGIQAVESILPLLFRFALKPACPDFAVQFLPRCSATIRKRLRKNTLLEKGLLKPADNQKSCQSRW